ncbi:uncharacterized protein N7446_010562 [Penicillium canescens]|uniref:Uncharacterized protein n=1 Tax=Penicillium canescens TaxID=5083 RepID=A0AAD6ICG5_PENCN|nr:uncharacterized protein N7446_010562 [Penicillium canescens]KAJ6041556.1 hypothetical protein N7460_006946 [Penicillium canescens]KAJ6050453.1 hypothetical protein N7446_010562 [Penicillium canescens]KAJ6064756.1 hypothetical protein N7444_000409 [Penicillium canescens]
MDETTRGFLAQAIRDAFTSSGIDYNEEYIDSLISKVDNDVLEAHLASQDGNTEESSLRTTGSALQTPPASPHGRRGSYRILNAPKRNYGKLAGPEPRKRRKRPISKLSKNCGDKSPSDRIPDEPIEAGCQNISQQPDYDHVKGTRHLDIPVDISSSYQADSAYAVKAMSSILFECARVNLAIALYGHRTSGAPTTTKPDNILKYVDEISEYDYEKAIDVIRRDNALATGKGLQNRYNETIFWKIILKGAALIDHTKLPSAKGPADGFTMAEKAATKKFMEDAGYGLGAENQRQCRVFWKNLFEMREAGIDKVLYYRTKQFDSYCKGYPKTSEISLVDAIMKWETQHRPHIEQLETRALRLAKGDLMRLSDLEHPQVVERLKVHESSWNNAKNERAFTREEESFNAKGLQAFSPEVLCAPYDYQLVSDSGADKSTFTSLLPKDGSSLFACSIVPVREGDFLGIFAGKIRFSENWSTTHGIRGPIDSLWLDYSQVTGTLNQMLVSEPGGPANVRLQWEVIHDDIGTDSCTSWRVSVKATKPIMPFDPFVRVAAQQEQYVLHLSSENAKRGFLGLCEAD